MRWRRNTLPAVLAAALSVLPPGRRNGFSHGGPTAVTEDSLSGAGGTAPAPDRPEPPSVSRPGERGAHTAAGRPDTGSAPGEPRQRLRAWAELLRVSALFSVPGDALAGAAAVGRRPGRGTALAIGASLCLYEAGMALNDWADRDEDAVDRPHRPIPSGRISPAAALGAAGVLTATGLALAARAGRPALTVATGLAATVWAYDLHLKHTKAGPAAMAAARSLDLLLGATATATGVRAPGGTSAPDNVAAATPSGLPACLPALPAALVLGAHTYGVTAVSRHETQGGSTGTPLAVLATTTALAAAVLRESGGRAPGRPGTTRAEGDAGPVARRLDAGPLGKVTDPVRLLAITLTGAYLRTAGPPLLHAALNPSPPLTQRAVGGGIRAMIPLQAALTARAGAPVTALAVMGLVPLARSLARKVSLT
ncbi:MULTISPECIES: SCO3242 family prenyltransferase [Streptomyces]|uniref:SCO3242 family prenyltransferase n=1 Tax=Streptomyces TaxID=1883 RepID=UPI000241A966|nr:MULTISPECIES: UbiA family prenyltransferase [Streptomyces]EHM29977.1 UbiA prenyltransferase [Streptomyces sp. W007]MCX4522446.1 UbiA family prenyltransferase [Streptomyces anulatus]MCX4605322.1 UbiA family prenyltransferase [Streptomyces anulatus]WSU77421.1 UbiA family prenyltransferase [Streptomyces anulatus]WTD24151.1 UbiA family prenyltransferase [Streptomyces anulatus]